MKSVLVGCLLLLFVAEVRPNTYNWQAEFIGYARAFGKTYSTQEEFNFRLNNYRTNIGEAGRLNVRNPHAHFGPTRFSDLTKEEFQFFLGGKPPASKGTRTFFPPRNITAADEPHPIFRSDIGARSPNPTTYDWCAAKVITPVKDQGECGSCWAFSAMETIESYHALKSGSLVSLSAEQIVDCDNGNGDEGCDGGWPSTAYGYVKSAGGIESEESYPYTATYGSSGSCQFNRAKAVTSVAASYSVSGGEAGLHQYLSSASGGPLSVCVAAETWQNYQGGVLSSCDTSTDHCVQLTGYENYGASNAVWRVRNQWGTSWGENGYMRIAIGSNLCGIANYATYVATTS